MVDKFTFSSAGEIQEVEFALARNEWTHPLLKKATGGDFFGMIREVLEGRAEICRIERLTGSAAATSAEYTIDCDAKPLEPISLTVADESKQFPNRVRGRLAFDPTKVKLYPSPIQQGGKYSLNANVLDFYLANPHLILEEWRGKRVFFLGTIYRDSCSRLYVRYLFCCGIGWYSNHHLLDRNWGDHDLVALYES